MYNSLHIMFILPLVTGRLFCKVTPNGWILYQAWLTFIKHRWPLSRDSGAQSNIKMLSYQYKESHYKDEMVIRPLYFHNGNSYTGKMTCLYWVDPQLYFLFHSRKYVQEIYFQVLIGVAWGTITSHTHAFWTRCFLLHILAWYQVDVRLSPASMGI